jgi:hypothetical protein
MRRFSVAVAILALALSGCGTQKPVSIKNGTIVVRRDVVESSLFRGVLGVHVGSSASALSRTFGEPFTKITDTFHGERETCWAYHARQSHSSLDAIDFCVNSAGRVGRIGIGSHL